MNRLLALVCIVLLLYTPCVLAAPNVPIPKSYDVLVDSYTAAIEIALEYQKLYEESEQANRELLQTIDELSGLIDQLQRANDKLQSTLDRTIKRNVGATVGIIPNGWYVGAVFMLW